jgi:hypothetical protein
MNQIKEGDTVSHSFHNGGRFMTVIDVNESQACCSLIDENNNPQKVWIDKSELKLEKEGDGGFVNL